MKNVFPFLFALILMSSCQESVEITATTTFVDNVEVSIPQSNGTDVIYDETEIQNLNELVSNYDDITDINIDNLSYTFTNLSGNSNAVITSATVEINETIVATTSTLNIGQEVTNETVFEITDTALLNQLENTFLTNSSVSIRFYGSVSTEDGSVDFNMQVSIGLTATF
jgi:hypothetical protein